MRLASIHTDSNCIFIFADLLSSAPYFTNRSYLAYRIAAPLTLYSVVSFFYAMVNLPFKVDFGAKYSYHNGFFLWAFVLNLGMASLGLATEFMITIIGPKFMPFFLIPLIIANVL